jgi:hypothetical protein
LENAVPQRLGEVLDDHHVILAERHAVGRVEALDDAEDLGVLHDRDGQDLLRLEARLLVPAGVELQDRIDRRDGLGIVRVGDPDDRFLSAT